MNMVANIILQHAYGSLRLWLVDPWCASAGARAAHLAERCCSLQDDVTHKPFIVIAYWRCYLAWWLQAITLPQQAAVPDVHDDMARELAFYKQGLAAAQEAIARFTSAGAPRAAKA